MTPVRPRLPRAATDPARLLTVRDRGPVGAALLWLICDGFTEGDETPDLKAARALPEKPG